MRKFSWVLLVLLVFSVYAEDEKLLVVESVEELKGITAKKITWKRDGAEMVSIPASDTTEPFWMDVTEVTVSQFKEFIESSGYKPDDAVPREPINWNSLAKYSPTDQHPMIYVSWYDATAYAE